jgi:hypothetical protein
MNFVARSPGRAEPETATQRNDEKSYRRFVAVGRSTIFLSVTGTVIRVSTSYAAMRASKRSGSGCRRRICVLSMTVAIR